MSEIIQRTNTTLIDLSSLIRDEGNNLIVHKDN